MQINCICCGHRFDLGRAYDDYEGLVRCSTCRGLLDIRTQDGAVKGVRPAALGPMALGPVAPAGSTSPDTAGRIGLGATDQPGVQTPVQPAPTRQAA